jgi:sugar phosphate isomerase/epimerase
MHTRREFLTQSLVTAIAATLATEVTGKSKFINDAPSNDSSYSINIFSKNLHWLGYQEMARAAADMGFDGVDLTVRPEGHVLPERVADDLPKAVEAIRHAGLNVHMITTAINDANDPYTDSILKTASSLGISCYRTGWINYDLKISVEENLNAFRVRLADLAALNKKHNIRGDYQNHSGTSFGSPVWDLWMILNQLDPKWMGTQYDILHATVEGANSWTLGFDLLKKHIQSMDIKDFRWEKKENSWKAEVVPLGQGMVDYKKYFQLLKVNNIKGPLSMHFEYPLGGAENGAKIISIKREDVFAAMKRDVVQLRKMLKESGLKA